MLDLTSVMSLGVAVTTLGGAWLTVRKISKDAHRSKKEQAAEILGEAKEMDLLLKSKLEARVEALKMELKNLEYNVNRDMGHMKETYASEMKSLGDKIEALRDELRNQHSGIVALLAKLVDKS